MGERCDRRLKKVGTAADRFGPARRLLVGEGFPPARFLAQPVDDIGQMGPTALPSVGELLRPSKRAESRETHNLTPVSGQGYVGKWWMVGSVAFSSNRSAAAGSVRSGTGPEPSGRLGSSMPSAMLEQEAQIFGLRERALPFTSMGSPQHRQIREFMRRHPAIPRRGN